MANGTLYIGTSGYSYDHWVDVFYPESLPAKDRLLHYARYFGTVELNSTFYRLPGPAAFDAWRDRVGEDFRFAVKASRYLTHVKRLKEPQEALTNFLDRARLLAPKLGPVLYQLPPRWRPDLERLKGFCEALPNIAGHVVEFRDPRWHIETVRKLLVDHEISFCIHDFPDCPSPEWATGPIVYYRLHGAHASYAGSYSRRALKRLADRLAAWQVTGRAVYVYFNNDEAGYAVKNALTLKALVE